MYLLYLEVGYAALVVALALLAWGYFQEVVSSWIGRTRRAFVKFTAERTKLMNEILQGIRVVKLYAWEESAQERVNNVRVQEVGQLRQYLLIRMMNTVSKGGRESKSDQESDRQATRVREGNAEGRGNTDGALQERVNSRRQPWDRECGTSQRSGSDVA
jgi:ABC-type multidrug transport system fused ATPase/permease subunit